MNHQEIVKILLDERRRLVAYAWSFVRDSHEAEDLFQDLCLRALGESHRFNDGEHLVKWAMLAIRDRSINHLRSAHKRIRVLDDAALGMLEQSWYTTPVPSGNMTEALEHCVDQLPPHSRELLELKYRKGLQGSEIAEASGRKRDTIYKSISRIQHQLHDCIDSYLGENTSEVNDD